ncbi:aldo/keto reductase [Trichococcus paludicola]|uniref:aldo/keto reductase n=1 Tax=Trichococcus paludicola TaxID=2052942 RepID=UPI000D3AA694|nr:aldo/keto reductase [Trichococcus paludicola]
MEYVTLNNGIKMPILGYGVYQIPDAAECERCVLDAIEVGYRSIDTAQAYGNEEAVGIAIKKSGVAREELFITTKVWITNAGYEKAKASIAESLQKLQLDYLDLVLIHQPFGDYYGTYRAMEELYEQGKIRAIGVSNFYPDRYIDLVRFTNVVPAVNQVETHVFNQQLDAHEIMQKYGTQIESWGPFAEGRNELFTNETLRMIGDKYNKTTAQVALRYLLQRGVVVIPKTTHKVRMIQNLDVFDFSVTEEDMETIKGLDKKESAFFSHYDPKLVEMLVNRG